MQNLSHKNTQLLRCLVHEVGDEPEVSGDELPAFLCNTVTVIVIVIDSSPVNNAGND